MAREEYANGDAVVQYYPDTEQFWVQNGIAGFWATDDEMSNLVELLFDLFVGEEDENA